MHCCLIAQAIHCTAGTGGCRSNFRGGDCTQKIAAGWLQWRCCLYHLCICKTSLAVGLRPSGCAKGKMEHHLLAQVSDHHPPTPETLHGLHNASHRLQQSHLKPAVQERIMNQIAPNWPCYLIPAPLKQSNSGHLACLPVIAVHIPRLTAGARRPCPSWLRITPR